LKASLLKILNKKSLSTEDLIYLLKLEDNEKTELFSHAAAIKEKHTGNKVFFRGLIEFSNICSKNCFYCGIRSGNSEIKRYNLSDKEILDSARFALDNNYGSIVLQSGEIETKTFTYRINKLLQDIARLSAGKLRVTLSCGEQKPDVYRMWYESGAHRYLLRIETSDPELYKKLHPGNLKHSYKRRLECLYSLQDTGYQTGTGIMIGLPFQTYENLADDLIFMRDFNIDMVGMGPYLEHYNTPLYEYRHLLASKEERLQLTLKMVALLRIITKDINIAATTAMQAIDPMGREKALMTGANVIMPNITPGEYRDDYLLYNNKPCTSENAEDCKSCLEIRIAMAKNTIAYGEWGDSLHYSKRIK